MEPYLVPKQNAEQEFVEKRSRFLGHLFCVETEAAARACIAQVKKSHHDARHHCWCYIVRDEKIERYSDDGEPQGTAGQPMLAVFQREGITNFCFVSTRYFGGILLGAGGLVRAYTKSAKDTLDAAGIATVSRWLKLETTISYSLFERVKLEVEAHSGTLVECDYGEAVTLRALFPEENTTRFSHRMIELSNGQCHTIESGEHWLAGE